MVKLTVISPRSYFRCGPLTLFEEIQYYVRMGGLESQVECLYLNSIPEGATIEGPILFTDGNDDRGPYVEGAEISAVADTIKSKNLNLKGPIMCIINNMDQKVTEEYSKFFKFFSAPVMAIPYRSCFTSTKLDNSYWYLDQVGKYFKWILPQGANPRPLGLRRWSVAYASRKSSFRRQDLLDKAKSYKDSYFEDLEVGVSPSYIQNIQSNSKVFLCGASKELESPDYQNTLEYTAIDAILQGSIPILGKEYYKEARKVGIEFLTYEDDWGDVSYLNNMHNFQSMMTLLTSEGQFDLTKLF